MKSSMSIRKWYGRSVSVPGYSSSNYSGFILSCLGIVRSIVEKNIGKHVRLHFTDTGTASADHENALIHINAEYLKGYFGLPEGRVDSDIAISAILGIIVHEAAHFAWSPPTLLPFAEYVKENTTCVYNEQLAAILGNIVEDIYIEAEVGRTVPSLEWMLEAMNSLVLSEDILSKAVHHAKDIDVAPDNMLDVVKVLDALLIAKLNDDILSTPYIEALFAEAHSARELTNLNDRKHLTLELYDRIMCNISQEESDKGEGGSEKVEDGAGKALDEIAERVKGLMKDGSEGKVGVSNAFTKHLNEIMQQMEDATITLEPDPEPRSFAATDVYYEEVVPQGTAVEMDERYQRLAEVGRQRAVVNRPYGEQRNRGTNIRNLHRIATDSRIFAQPVTMNNYKPMQVIILLDCSGSMCVGMLEAGRKSDGELWTRIEMASKATLGAAYGLVHAHCEVAVYGHTAEKLSGTEVSIYRIKEFGEPITVVPGRLGTLQAVEYLIQNRDGYALSYVAKKFRDKRKRQLLIVISDGSPVAGFGYRDQLAREHSKESVDAVRAQGIDVLSISITKDASSANDYIYGSAHNVYNADPNVIEDIVRTLVLK